MSDPLHSFQHWITTLTTKHCWWNMCNWYVRRMWHQAVPNSKGMVYTFGVTVRALCMALGICVWRCANSNRISTDRQWVSLMFQMWKFAFVFSHVWTFTILSAYAQQENITGFLSERLIHCRLPLSQYCGHLSLSHFVVLTGFSLTISLHSLAPPYMDKF